MSQESERKDDPTPLPPEPTQSMVNPTELRLKILEQIHEKMFSMVQWGFGTIATVALALIAANIYTSHSNYERDSTTLKQDVDNLEKQLSLENEKQLFASKTEAESSFVTISNNLENQLDSIIKTNNAKWAIITANISNLNTILATNILTLDSAIKAEVFIYMTNNLHNVDTSVNAQFDTFRANFDRQTAAAMAGSLLVQANDTVKKTNQGKQSAFHDYIDSAIYYLRARDEQNAQSAIKGLTENNIFQLYLLNISKENYKIQELQHPLSNELQELINQLNTFNTTGRYEDELQVLKYCNELIVGKLSK